MADKEPAPKIAPKPILPRSMRPRSTPNAEINAQEGDKVRREMGFGYPLAPNQSYAKGGKIKGNPFASGGPEMRRSPSLDHRNLFKR